MDIHTLFAVPLIEFRHPAAEELCPRLTRFFLNREQDDYRDDISRDTQVGPLFESRFDLFYWQEPEIRPMVDFCHRSLARVVAELNGYGNQQMQQLRFDYHAWFHVTRKGGFQAVHNHPNASWSGIFCIDPGEPASDPREGTVRFYDPKGNANYYQDPGNAQLSGPFSMGGSQITHEPGKLWIFPSYMLHEVFPYQGKKPRVIVAFNAWLSAADGRKEK